MLTACVALVLGVRARRHWIGSLRHGGIRRSHALRAEARVVPGEDRDGHHHGERFIGQSDLKGIRYLAPEQPSGYRVFVGALFVLIVGWLLLRRGLLCCRFPISWAILAAMFSSVLLVLCGYLLGSVPTGFLAGRARGVDVRRAGSGNIGMANVLRTAGKWPAVVTMAGDMLKGFAPVFLARLVTENEWVVAAVALAAVVGHCWPVFLRFKGGKAVATGAGTTIALAPVVGLMLFAFWWVVVAVSRYTSLGAISVMVVTPVVFLLTGQPIAYVLYTIVGGSLVLWRHRENALALVKGTERKIGQKAQKQGGARVR